MNVILLVIAVPGCITKDVINIIGNIGSILLAEELSIEMPINYVVEMFCDRVAATMVYQGTQFNFKAPLDYYNKTHHYYVINEKTDRILRDMLERLANSNLDETIEYIKEKYLRNH